MKPPFETKAQTTEEQSVKSELITFTVLGNGQYEVRIRLAGLDKSQLVRVPAHGHVTVNGPAGSHVFDAISRRLLFQISPETSESPQRLADYY